MRCILFLTFTESMPMALLNDHREIRNIGDKDDKL